MTALRPGLPEPPERIARLPRDERGYPVPWFVESIDGKPEFRVVSPERMVLAVRRHLCWICGDPLGRFLAFTVGPMCAVNRTSGEPPAHLECATYAAVACPFLTKPHMRRRDGNLPDLAAYQEAAITRNPGVALVWVTRAYMPFSAPGNDLLFTMGEPTSVHWYAEGRPATRAEVDEAIRSGLPILAETAQAEGPEAVAELAVYVERVQPYLPVPA